MDLKKIISLRVVRWYIVPLLLVFTISAFKTVELMGIADAQPVPVEEFVNFESSHVHPMDITPDSSKILAVNTANNTLEVFSIIDGNLVNTASIPVGMDPVTVRARSNSEAWVANVISDNVSIVDLNQKVVTRTLQTENEPSDIVFAGTPLRAFVSCAERESIQIFDLSNLSAAPQEVLLIGEQPRAMAVSADGNTVYTAFFESGNQTTVINGNTSMTAGLQSPQGGTTAIPNDITNPAGPYSGAVPVPNSGTGFLPTMNPALPAKTNTQSLVVRKNSSSQWMDDNGGNWTNIVSGGAGTRQSGWDLKDRDVAVLNANTLSLSYQNHLGNILMAIGINPLSGKVSIVGTDATNEVRFEPNLNANFLRVNISQFTPGSSSNSIKDLNSHLTYATSSVAVSERQKSIGDPRGIVWKSNGTKAYITGMGSNNVITVDAAGSRTNPQPIPVGEGPTGIILDEGRNQAYVLNRFDATISTLDLTTDQEVATIDFFDPTPEVIKTGRKHLYNTHIGSGTGHVACGSCHVDGKWDRLGWDLGNPAGDVETVNGTDFHPLKGLKVTQSLIDILDKGDGLLHWRGDKAAFIDFAGAFNHLQGTAAPLDAAGMQEFEDFLASTYHPPSPYRPFRPVTDSPTIRMKNGKIRGPGTTFQTIQTSVPIFVSVEFNCSLCHLANTGRGPAGTYTATGNENISADLRTTYRKLGFYYNSDESTSGFGMMSDGVMETWFNQSGVVDYLGDYQAEVMAWAGGIDPTNSPASIAMAGTHESQDSHAAVGLQATRNGSIGTNAEVNELRDLANDFNALGLIVKGIYQGERRGFYYLGSNNYQSDSAGQTVTHTQLLTAATGGDPLTWMLVHKEIEERAGVDRNSNGLYDFEERMMVRMAVMLEGPYDSSTGLMADTYNANSLLSNTDPFGLGTTLDPSVLALTNEDAVVDWMKIQLRDENDSAIVLNELAVLVQRDGDIIDKNGNARIAFEGLASDNYYVSITHANHFGVMSNSPINISVNPMVDFTNPSTSVYSNGGAAMREISGVMVLWSGDANGDGTVNAVDKNNFWRLENGQPYQYGTSKADFNLDGVINAVDKNALWRVNNSLVEQLP